jgi:anaerobic selenocysteine-containing dehydrogenase
MIKRRDFLKLSIVGAGVGVVASGAVKSFIPSLEAGSDVTKFDKIPVSNGDFAYYPPFDKWNSWKEMDGDDWKNGGTARHDVKVHDYMLVPTACNNCEASCGLLAYVDKESMSVKKIFGNPLHTASLGRTCAKGIAAYSQMYDPDRIPFPLKRAPGSKRGEGKWIRTTWDEALATIGKKIRETLKSGDATSKKAIMYHVGRPNENGFTPRVWHTLGQDCTNSHTNICSANGRVSSLMWVNDDRTAPDWANSKLVLLASSHAADAGHYFQQSAGLIAKARKAGAKLVVIDPRMSNSAGVADLWIAAWPGTEAAIFLAIANRILHEGKYDAKFVKDWYNWQNFMDDKAYMEYLKKEGFITTLPKDGSFESFIEVLKDMYKDYTMEWASKESHVPLDRLEKLYEYFVWAGKEITSFNWRGPSAGNRGGWLYGKNMIFALSLVGSMQGKGQLGFEHMKAIFVAGKGGKACQAEKVPNVDEWNELSWPPEWPLASYELSMCLPHLLVDTAWQEKWRAKGLTVPSKLAVWFSRQYNPVWINPDGFRWVDVLKDETKMELTVNPSPTWSETNWYMDYILPIGLAGERHDQHSEASKPEAWTSFRQPVLRVMLEKTGWKPKNPARATLEAHMKAGLGEIWEENEMWINLVFAADPDGSLGIRQYWESKANPGKPVTIPEYYDAAFANLPNLAAAAATAAAQKAQNAKTPLEKELAAFAQKYPNYDFMRDRGTWTEATNVFDVYKREVHIDHEKHTIKTKAMQFWQAPVEYPMSSVKIDPRTNVAYVQTPEGRHNVGVQYEGKLVEGFETPSKKLDFYVDWMKEWGWPEYAIPMYPKNEEQKKKYVHVTSQVNHIYMKEPNAFALNPIFRLAYNIHTRSINSKWLMEISQNHNPVWMAPGDAKKLGLKTGDPIKVRVVDTLTDLESGYFVGMCVTTEGILPGTLACSHHAGRWRLVDKVDIPGFEQPLVVLGTGAPLAEIKKEGFVYSLNYKDAIKPQHPKETKEFGANGWPYAEFNKDMKHIYWNGLTGTFQNATFSSNPDPIGGMQCWHKKVLIEKAGANDKIGDVKVNIDNNMKIFQAWRDKLTRPAPGPKGLRRPEHLKRPWVPLTREAYKMPTKA